MSDTTDLLTLYRLAWHLRITPRKLRELLIAHRITPTLTLDGREHYPAELIERFQQKEENDDNIYRT